MKTEYKLILYNKNMSVRKEIMVENLEQAQTIFNQNKYYYGYFCTYPAENIVEKFVKINAA